MTIPLIQKHIYSRTGHRYLTESKNPFEVLISIRGVIITYMAYLPAWVFKNVPLDDQGHDAVMVAQANVGTMDVVLTG